MGRFWHEGCGIDADETTDEVLPPFAQSALSKMWCQAQYATDPVQTVRPGGPPTEKAQVICQPAVQRGCQAGE